MLSFFPRDVLDEILNLIESVSEGFPSYTCSKHRCLVSVPDYLIKTSQYVCSVVLYSIVICFD